MNKIRAESFQWRPIIIACLLVSIGQFCMGLVFPSLPWIAKDFSISSEQAQLLISFYLLGFGPSQLIYGPLSDAFGRRPVLFFGLIVLLFGLSFTVFFAHSFHALVLGRFLQGLGGGCMAVLSRASIRDSYKQQNFVQAINYLSIATSLTPVIAPIIGGFLNHYLGWISVFIFLLAYSSILFLGALIFFKETLRNAQTESPITLFYSYIELVHDRYFLSFAGIGWINYGLIVISVSLMPFIMQVQIGMTSDIYALWVLFPAISLLIGALLCSRLRSKLGIKKTLLLVPVIQVISGIWFIFCPLTPINAMFGQSLLNIANGIAFPCAQSQMLLPYKKRSGTVSALYGACQMLVAALSSMLLLYLGLKQLWHLGLVMILASIIGRMLIKNGFKQEEIAPPATDDD